MKITANGTYTIPLTPGSRYVVSIAGNLGGATLYTTFSDASSGYALPIDPAYDALITPVAFELLAPNGLMSIDVSGGTAPAFAVNCTLCAE